MVDVLKPCPFCGSDAFMFRRENGHWAYCSNDGCGAETQGKTTPSDAAAAWNRRSTLSDAVAEREAEPVATLCTLGVGDGSGKLFVHGDYDSIKAAQAIIFQANETASELEALRKRVAELEKAVAEISAEAKIANDVIRLNRDGGGNGRVKVATAMHRIDQAARRVREGWKNG